MRQLNILPRLLYTFSHHRKLAIHVHVQGIEVDGMGVVGTPPDIGFLGGAVVVRTGGHLGKV
jgi:hypothetical protein